LAQKIPLRVLLSADTRRALLASVPATSRAWAPVTDAVELPGANKVPSAWMVMCDLEAALTLLSVAERRCPEAVQPIMDAVHRSL
jgi:hypothetical protein